MRKLIILIGLLAAGVSAYADIASDIDVQVHVNSKFELSIDRTSIDFEGMDPGQIKDGVPEAGIRVSAKTNCGNPWYLKISTAHELSNGSDFIPNENFFWYGWKGKESNGVFWGDRKRVFTSSPDLVYTPVPGEYNNLHMVNGKAEGTDVYVKLGLKIPVNQNAGNYHTVVRFTMTE